MAAMGDSNSDLIQLALASLEHSSYAAQPICAEVNHPTNGYLRATHNGKVLGGDQVSQNSVKVVLPITPGQGVANPGNQSKQTAILPESNTLADSHHVSVSFQHNSRRSCFIGGHPVQNSAYTTPNTNFSPKTELVSVASIDEETVIGPPNLGPNEWVCHSPEEVMKLVDDHEKIQIVQFSRRRVPNHNSWSEAMKWRRIGWSQCTRTKQSLDIQIPFNGAPSMIVQGLVRLFCRHGSDLCVSKKSKYRQMHQRIRRSTTIKKDCPAFVSIKEVLYFPEYKVDILSHTLAERKTLLRKLKANIESGIRPIIQRVYYVRIPEISHHRNHPVGQEAACMQKMDERIRDKINELVEMGLTRAKDVQKHVNLFVKDLVKLTGMEAPLAENTRFYPKYRTIYNTVVNTQQALSRERFGTAPQIDSNQPIHHVLQDGQLLEDRLVEVATTEDDKLLTQREVKRLQNKTSRLAERLVAQSQEITDVNTLQLINNSIQNIRKWLDEQAHGHNNIRTEIVEVAEGLTLNKHLHV